MVSKPGNGDKMRMNLKKARNALFIPLLILLLLCASCSPAPADPELPASQETSAGDPADVIEGEIKNACEVARKMISDDLPPSLIAKYTGLTLDFIESLRIE